MARCQATKHDGTPCERIVGGSQQYCYAHDPENAEQRRAAASKAGKVRTGGELAEVRGRLRQLADDVLEGRVQKAEGSVAAQILGVYLRAVEQERKTKETEEFEARLEALERARGISW